MPWLDTYKRMPRAARADTVLTTTATLVAATLGVWLILWLLFVRPKVQFTRVQPEATPVAFNSLSGLLTSGVGGRNWQPLELHSADAIRDYLDSRDDRPMILYLAAPATDGRLGRSGLEIEGDVWKGVIPYDPVDAIGIRKLLEICQSRKRKAKLLLILDPGRIGTDPALGLFGDSIARQLRREGTPPADLAERSIWNDRWRNLGVLCACEPEQFSWPIEGLERSAFDHALINALSESRKLRFVIDRVRNDVARWVRAHVRHAVQTPMYVGDPGLDFFIPASRFPANSSNDSTEVQLELRNRFQKEYERRDALAGRRPYSFALAAWRHYQERLLQAERLYRAGRMDDASDRLNLARRVEPELTSPSESAFGSLGLGLRHAPEGEVLDAIKKLDGELAQALVPAKPPTTGKEADADPEAFPALSENRWRSYVEGQLLDWLIAYRKLPLSEGAAAFTGHRKSLFTTALEVRRRAETIAAGAIDSPTSARLAVENGDRHRRMAQDDLFVGRGDALLNAEEEFKTASRHYEVAREILAAIELLGRVQSELPFLGAWYVRHSARDGRRGFDEPFRQIAERAEVLRAMLTNPRLHESDSIALLSRAREDLSAVDEQLRRDFRVALEQAPESSDWRMLDDLLLVPVIPAKTRMVLVDRVRAFQRPVPPAAESQAADKSATGKLVKAAVNRGLSNELRQQMNTALDGGSPPAANSADRDPGPSEPVKSVEDPTYRLIASGMARLEWVLLAIGSGLPKGDLRSLAGEIDSVADSSEEASTRARTAFCMKLREMRTRVWDRLQRPESGESGSHSVELAHAALPGHFALDSETSERGRARYRELLRWMSRRLIEDFDPGRARGFLHSEASQKNEWTDRVDRLEKERPIRVMAPGDLKFDQTSIGQLLKVDVDEAVPEGKALLVINAPEPRQREMVWLTQGDMPLDDGAAALIRSGKTEEIPLVLNRRGAGPGTGGEAASVALATNLFYRGRVYKSDRWTLAIKPIKSQFVIRVETDREAVRERGNKEFPGDQFVDHPDSGYVYPGWRHPSKFTVEYITDDPGTGPVDVELEYGLKERSPPAHAALTLQPNVKTDLARHEIEFDPAAADKPRLKGANFREQKYQVKLWRKSKNRDRKAPPDAENTFTFYELNPEVWNRVQVSLLPAEGDPPEYEVDVTVTRSRNDPIVNRVSVQIEWPSEFRPARESDGKVVDLRKGRSARDDSHTFRFRAPVENLKRKDVNEKDLEFVAVIAANHRIVRRLPIPGRPAATASQPELPRESAASPSSESP